MIGEAIGVNGNDSVICTGAPNLVELLIEVRCGLWVDNETSFCVFAL